MDLPAACRVFVSVGERATFTLGAAAASVPQSVASRRIAALEKHLGVHLFDRTTRRAALTPFGQDLGIDPEVEFPVSSLAKVPLALAVAERIEVGSLDPAAIIQVPPGQSSSPGPSGPSRFRHPAWIAVEDLLRLCVSATDNAAADALFALVPPAEVNRMVQDAGVTGISIRHVMKDLLETPVERFAPEEVHLAHSLAIGSWTSGRGHPVRQLDVRRANSGTARAFVDLLAGLWNPVKVSEGAAARVRSLMGNNMIRHRLAPDLASDSAKWSSKTGTPLNPRHEVGVVEHDDGGMIAVAALTESTVPAAIQPAAEAMMGRVARALHDQIR